MSNKKFEIASSDFSIKALKNFRFIIMKAFLLLALLATALCSELLVTREYVDYLKSTVSWEVEDYENNVFRGWTVEEAQSLFGWTPSENRFPNIDIPKNLPSEIDWSHANCDHGPQNQGRCGSCWAFAAVGSLASRCCLMAKDQGWLSPQELVSCDKKDSGCNGGGLEEPVEYEVANNGLVKEACFPYQAKDMPCPKKCVGGEDWKASHVCKCQNPRACQGTAGMKACLQSGPATLGFYVCRSFMNYKSGIYKCDCTSYIGGHAITIMGHSDTPECHYIARNSWGPNWGDKGYFKIACETCKLETGNVCEKVN